MRVLLIVAGLIVVSTTSALAQTDPVTTPPPNIILPNYNGVPAGPLGALESSANVARAADASATWLNPAGLSQAGTQLTGSSGTYKLTTVSPSFLPSDGGSTEQIPDLVGLTYKFRKLTAGLAMITTISWSQGLDTDDVFTNPEGNPERLAFTIDSGLHQRAGVVAVGYDINPKWRVGGGLVLQETGIRSAQVISDRIQDSLGLHTLLISSRSGGSGYQFRTIFGFQAAPTSTIRVGGMIRTKGIAFKNGGDIVLDSTLDGASVSTGASIFDKSAGFAFNLPFEAAGGVAYVIPRAEIEFDIESYSSIAPHALLSSTEPLTIYTDAGNGNTSIVDHPLPPIITASDAVQNYSLGGHVRLTDTLTVHAGVATDHSPVAPEDQVFDEVDFNVWTLGLSGTFGKLTFALGGNYRKGSSDNITVRNLLSEPIQTSISIKTIGLTYSIAYKF